MRGLPTTQEPRSTGRPVVSRVFVNFRNGDEPYAALLIATTLRGWFGDHAVFRSSDSIRAGDDYAVALDDAVRRCDVILAVIGERWLSVVDHDGQPRLGAPDDWVCRELALGFANGKRVIPVLVSGARRPAWHELPAPIAPLARCQYRRIEHRQFHAAIRELAADLMELLPGLRPVGNGQPVPPVANPGETVVRATGGFGEKLGGIDNRP